MAAGTLIQLKRKAGAFTGGELAAGEAGVDTTNGNFYFSANGSTVILVARGLKIAVISDVKAYNVTGGTFTSGADRTRDLNTEYDPDSIVSLTSNAFTPIAGTYLIEWSCPAYAPGRHFSKLHNKTAGTLVKLGGSIYDGTGTVTLSQGVVKTECNGTDEYEIRHRCDTTVSSIGFGTSHNISGSDNIYTQVKLIKLG